MAADNAGRSNDHKQQDLEALRARLDAIEKKLDKNNEDIRGVAAFFFLLALMLAVNLSLPHAIIAAMALTIAYVAYVDYRTIRRSDRHKR